MDKEEHLNRMLMRHYELIWNGHHHTEKLSHEILNVLTAIIIGTWAISSKSVLLENISPDSRLVLSISQYFWRLQGLYT